MERDPRPGAQTAGGAGFTATTAGVGAAVAFFFCTSASSFEYSTRNTPAATSTIPATSFQPGGSKEKFHGSFGFGCHRLANSVLMTGASPKMSGAMNSRYLPA